MMNDRVELMDKDMDLVNGGNYGDNEVDQGDFSMYSVGQEIEMYITGFHVTTEHHTIYAVKRIGSQWAYSVDPAAANGADADVHWIYADDIQHNDSEYSW